MGRRMIAFQCSAAVARVGRFPAAADGIVGARPDLQIIEVRGLAGLRGDDGILRNAMLSALEAASGTRRPIELCENHQLAVLLKLCVGCEQMQWLTDGLSNQ